MPAHRPRPATNRPDGELPPSVLDYNKREVQKQWDEDPCGANIVAPDLQLGSLAFCREGAAKCHTQRHLAFENCRPTRSTGWRAPFDDKHFDLVDMFGAASHRALVEIHMVLRPGDVAVVGLYHRDFYYHWIQKVLVEGLKLGFLTKGYRVTPEVEFRLDSTSALPVRDRAINEMTWAG
jgi:SAM-dependent methyltransferase